MQTYTYSNNAARYSNELGLTVTGPSAALDQSALFRPESFSQADILRSAQIGVAQIAQDLSRQGLTPKNTQVIVEAPAAMRSAIEDALRERNIQAAYREQVLDSQGLTVAGLTAPHNGAPEKRIDEPLKADGPRLDLSKPSEALSKVKEESFKTAPEKLSSGEAQERVNKVVSQIKADLKEMGAEGKTASVLLVDVPPRFHSLLESTLEKEGIQAVHPTSDLNLSKNAPSSAQRPEVVESTNSLASVEARGLAALRENLPDKGKGISDETLRSAIEPQVLQELGKMDREQAAEKAQAIAPFAENLSQQEKIHEIATDKHNRYNEDKYAEKYEKNGWPKDAVFTVWVGTPQIVLFAADGTSANMARGIDRVKDYLEAKNLDASKKEIIATLGKGALERIGKEGIDDKAFDRVRSVLDSAATTANEPRLKGVEVLKVLQQTQKSNVSNDLAIRTANKTELASIGSLRDSIAQMKMEAIQGPLVASLVKLELLKQEAVNTVQAVVAADQKLKQLEASAPAPTIAQAAQSAQGASEQSSLARDPAPSAQAPTQQNVQATPQLAAQQEQRIEAATRQGATAPTQVQPDAQRMQQAQGSAPTNSQVSQPAQNQDMQTQTASRIQLEMTTRQQPVQPNSPTALAQQANAQTNSLMAQTARTAGSRDAARTPPAVRPLNEKELNQINAIWNKSFAGGAAKGGARNATQPDQAKMGAGSKQASGLDTRSKPQQAPQREKEHTLG